MKERNRSTEVFASNEIESVCLLIGSLHISENLTPEFLGLVVQKLNNSLLLSKILTLDEYSKMYLSLSRVYKIYVDSAENAAF